MRMMRFATIAMAATLAIALAGCATGGGSLSGNAAGATAASAVTLNGSVHGGQQPISGATIQLYAVGITGPMSAATPLIGSTVTTNANGNFTLTGLWDCTSNTATYGTNPLLYVVATQGNPGLGGSVNNSAISLMAAIGPCSSFTASSFLAINELTTVGAVYALAPFMADYAHVGAAGANPTGLVNAFQTALLLVNPSTGAAPGATLSSNATAPVSELNTLADILAPCINSNGTDTNCSSLFGLATPQSGTAPTETIGALLNIAKSPGANVKTLFGSTSATPPYQPMLTTAPNDWTVALNFTGGGLNAPAGIAIDASGNVWVANASGNSITELSSTGAALTGSTGYTGSSNIFGAQGIAVDRTGNVWVADTLLSTVVELTLSGGTIQSSTSYTAGGISGPTALAIDSGNNVWVANFAGGSVTELNNAGNPVGSGALTAGGTLQTPASIGVDLAGNVWVADNGAGVIAEFNNSQTLLSGAGYSDGGILAPVGLALDASGNLGVADNGANALSLFTAAGTPLASSPITGGGINLPTAVAVDGQGTIWVANNATSGSISQASFAAIAPLSPATGLGVLNAPAALAIDASGSVWTANSGDNSVSEFVGLAAPVVTPLAATAGP